MTKRFLLVAGNIGAGKTSITRTLADRLGWLAAHETVSDNPFLADFYGDMRQWSFHLQVYFLGDRADQHIQMAAQTQSAIIDRSIYEDFHIFARALLELGNMTQREYDAYRSVYELVVRSLPRPDLLLYLDAPVQVLMDRIHNRGRAMESGISPDYLALLERYYREWIATFDLCPVLTIPASDLNFVENERHIAIVIDRIQEKLAGKEEVVFPNNL